MFSSHSFGAPGSASCHRSCLSAYGSPVNGVRDDALEQAKMNVWADWGASVVVDPWDALPDRRTLTGAQPFGAGCMARVGDDGQK